MIKESFLITGSSGFIGKALCKFLTSKGCKVYGIDKVRSDFANFNFKYFELDLLNIHPNELSNIIPKVDYIIHLAAKTDLSGKRLSEYDVNIEGVRRMCEYSGIIKPRKVLFASTQLVNCIGDSPNGVNDYNPDTFYGLSKVIGEEIVRSFFKNLEINWLIFRPTTVWGPGMSIHYQNFLNLILEKKYFHIGLKKKEKSFSYIGNSVNQIFELCINEKDLLSDLTIYLCDPYNIEIKQWANDLALGLGAPKPFSLPHKLCYLLALLNDNFSKVLRIKPPIPLTLRRLKNITTPYIFQSNLLWQNSSILYDYKSAIKNTCSWFLSKKNRKF
tara:strand:- start:239 stop:1228 length:990 start_codon:yes stop_codon:yes gene_type:complete